MGSFFKISQEERDALLDLLDQAKKVIAKELSPDSFNIGISDESLFWFSHNSEHST